MKRMNSAEVRQGFLDFFAARGHTIVPSASLVPVDDPSLLFTNAGMNQFKDVFLGLGDRPYVRAADTQKCMRVSGKHNDLDDVGRDGTHHTFFEMLGNWSFGDYYKKEAIGWAWELLTDVWKLPPERLWATVFKDDEGDLGPDDEAEGCWRSETGIDPEHIVYFGRQDNFWEMADTGPCGPCSEIHFDQGPDSCCCKDDPDHVCEVNGVCGRFVELWNLVFIQYNKDASGSLEPLPAQHVDTGAGLERLVAVLQGVDSNYKTDLFLPIIGRVQELTGHSDEEVRQNIVPYRVIADHGRAIAFLVSDGVLPGNEGRNYVLRMVLRRAARFGRKLGFTEPFLNEVIEVVIGSMGPHFPELHARRQFILTTVAQEEERFLRTLDLGLARLDQALGTLEADGGKVVPGDVAFRLYDTFGLPLEITRDVADERQLEVDEAGYLEALENQRQMAQEAGGFEERDEQALRRYHALLEDLREEGLLPEQGVSHHPYQSAEIETTIAAILRDGKRVKSVKEGDEIEVVLPETCFYVQSGGQLSDTGFIAAVPLRQEDRPAGRTADSAGSWEVEVTDVDQPVPGLIVHVGLVKRGRVRVGESAWAVVDFERRMDIARNHTATHLLHSELRYILGEHVQQAGSLVAPDRLRFDFTHPAMLTEDELAGVNRSVNDAILMNYPVEVSEQSYRDAVESGVIALFGEKYGERVRVIRVGWEDDPFSQELCGGTHVSETGAIGLFHIVSEQSVAAGVRRIEAVTGRAAAELVERQTGVLQRTAAYLGVDPEDVDRRTLALLDELQAAQKEIARLQQKQARQEFETLAERVQSVAGVPLLSARVSASSMDVLREMSDWFRERLGSGVVVLGAVVGKRPAIVAAVTRDLVERGIDARKLIKPLAGRVGGGGGGKPALAQAGGRDAGRLEEALEAAPGVLEKLVAGAVSAAGKG
jgi:alanyl-tRNA synthetase